MWGYQGGDKGKVDDLRVDDRRCGFADGGAALLVFGGGGK